MSISSRSRSRAFAVRADSVIYASEQPPMSLVETLTTMLLPHASKTPRGAPPSRALKRNIDQMRSGKDGAVRKLLAVLFHRRERGEPIEAVTAPLYLAAAALRGPESDDMLALAEADERAESESRLARQRYFAEPSARNLALLAESEATERSISDRICALALQVQR